MIISLGIILLIFFTVFFYFFVLRSVSPIPYFPTNKKDLPMIVDCIFELNGWRDRRGSQTARTQLFARDWGALAGTRERQAPLDNIFIDLGAGDGTVVFSAAQRSISLQRCNYVFVAIEINPILVTVMHLRRMFHKNKKNIKIIHADIFKIANFTPTGSKTIQAFTVYLYVGPFVMERLKPQLEKFPKNTRFFSYMYKIPGWEKRLKKTYQGVKKLYLY